MADFTPSWTDWTDPGPFRFWAQKVLPLVYDDSLSYYEVLCKVVSYLNTTITNVAALGGNVEGLRNAYTQLQAFVNNYFDNLDVQQEINTKLDEMAETGALTTLIEPFINSQISTDVARWLELNVKPTTPAIDASLTVSGAGADAKVVGEKISDLTKALNEVGEDIVLSGEATDTFRGLTVTRNGNRITINGTAEGNARFKVSGAMAHAVAVQSAWYAGASLVPAGNKKFYTRRESGTGECIIGIYNNSGTANASFSYENQQSDILERNVVVTSSDATCVVFYIWNGMTCNNLVIALGCIDIDRLEYFVGSSELAARLAETAAAVAAHAPALQNSIFGTYRNYPSFSYDGNSVIVTIPANSAGRAVWNNGYTQDANTAAQTYTVAHTQYLVYNTNTKTIRVETAASNFTADDIILIYNAQGAIYGQWAALYFRQMALENKTAIENLDVPKIPSYYNENDYLSTKASAIKNIALSLSRQAMQMFFITDIHWANNAKHSPELLHYLVNNTGIKTVIANGDYIVKDSNSKMGGYNILCEFLDEFGNPVGDFANIYYNTGNHEQNDPASNSEALRIAQPVIAHLFNTPIAYKIHPLDNVNSYYVDDATTKMRFYMVESDYKSEIGLDVRARIFESLLNVPEGYAVIVFSHVAINASDNTALVGRFQQIMQCCAAMNDGVSVTINDATYDFTGKARTFVGAIVGHLHKDVYVIYDGRFPVIGVAADTIDETLSSTRVVGTITEQAFDAIQVDVPAKRIYCTRIGAGNDRTFSFGDPGSGLVS